MNSALINLKTKMKVAACLLLCSLCVTSLGFGKAKYPHTQTGTAVYYSDSMDGHTVSLRGDKYDKTALTAAHKSFPLGSTVRVTNLLNKKSVTVKINDRMNPRSKAVIDLSRKAAEEIGMIRSGHAKVKIQLVSARR